MLPDTIKAAIILHNMIVEHRINGYASFLWEKALNARGNDAILENEDQ